MKLTQEEKRIKIVKPLVEAATRLCLLRKLTADYPHAGSEIEYAEEMLSSTLSTFTVKHKL